MAEENKTSYDPQVELIRKLVKQIAYDMRDDRNDGYVKRHNRDRLIKLRDFIDSYL